jgi:hypothetical protein
MARATEHAGTGLLLGVLLVASGAVSGQNPTGGDAIKEIRALEERERLSVLERNVAEVEALRDPAFAANTPDNSVTIGSQRGIERVRAGALDYERFDRSIEHIEVDGDVAVAMGAEVVQSRSGPQAGRVLHRRYTNVWLRKNGKWRLRFRHANLTPDESQILDRN